MGVIGWEVGVGRLQRFGGKNIERTYRAGNNRKYKKLRGVSTQPFTATGLTEFYSTYQIESQISIHQELLQSLPENIRTIKHRIISQLQLINIFTIQPPPPPTPNEPHVPLFSIDPLLTWDILNLSAMLHIASFFLNWKGEEGGCSQDMGVECSDIPRGIGGIEPDRADLPFLSVFNTGRAG